MNTANPRVCIDCSPLLVRSAGVKTYIYHWLRALRIKSPGSIRTFLAPRYLHELTHDGGLSKYPIQLITLILLNRLPELAARILAPRCDVFHVSNLLRKPPPGPRLSATLHDLTTWIFPDHHTPANVTADKAFARHILARAAGVIAVSESTKCDAVRILGLPPDKIHVVHLGVADTYFSVAEEAVLSAASFCNLVRPYFLFVGTIEPRKNVDTLLASWNSLPTPFRQEYDLVIAGMAGWRSDDTMRRILEADGAGTGVRYAGYVPEAFLPGLTAGATALVYPSLYEGFGLPVAQAMAAGTPVITSNVSSLPEVAAGAALLIDPLSVSELISAVLAVGESPGLRERLRARGLLRASELRWGAAAEASLRYFSAIA
jgi:glycosyltransferase involved in cell wall biosynthesis